jgi:UDP-N-acetylmuramate dehydrogenase
MNISSNIIDLPNVKGTYRKNYSLAPTNWFNVGGKADILFKPHDIDDLAFFIKNKPVELDYIVIGVGSNILVRDGGFRGVVIKLGKNFNYINLVDNNIIAGCATLDYNIANFSADNSMSGLEFLAGIPGTVGGGIAMNAGADGSDFSKVIKSIKIIDEKGNIKNLANDEIGFYYRGNSLPNNYIFVEATFAGKIGIKEDICNKIIEINNKREATQPIKSKTIGCTFRNPEDIAAWKLIEQAGCKNLKVGGASVSSKHCNFIINDDNASADDIEILINLVKQRVFEHSGITMETEVKIIGTKI